MIRLKEGIGMHDSCSQNTENFDFSHFANERLEKRISQKSNAQCQQALIEH